MTQATTSPYTSLLELKDLAERCGVRRVLVKAENERDLGNFKSLGGFLASMRAIERHRGSRPVLLCASEGNHGLSVAAAAKSAGVGARVYLSTSVDQRRADRIARCGADIVRVAGSYDTAVEEAKLSALRGEGILIADTTEDVEDVVVADVMSGYLRVADEVRSQLTDLNGEAPTHMFLQAGVGGFAAAMTKGLGQLGNPTRAVVVEPESAACVAAGLSAGRPVKVEGALETCATMLACGVASAPALAVLLAHGATALTASESELALAPRTLELAGGPLTSPSGAAGLAGFLKVSADPALRRACELDGSSTVLLFVTEAR